MNINTFRCGFLDAAAVQVVVALRAIGILSADILDAGWIVG